MLPRRTVRLRLTVLYGTLFLLSGAVLLTIADGFGSTASVAHAVPAGGEAVPAGSQEAASVHAAISRE